MLTLFKGAGVGTHWHKNDPRTCGGFFCAPGRAHSVSAIVAHINGLSHPSPYLSFSRSYAVPHAYAMTGTSLASAAQPAWIYEIDPTPLNLLDPVEEIGKAKLAWHHDGGPTLILGIADPTGQGQHLKAHPPRPAGTLGRPPQVNDELIALVNAIRDAEVLVHGAVPPACIVKVHQVP